MTEYINIKMTDEQIREISTQALAYVGDAVFELLVRTYLVNNSNSSVDKLHKRAIAYVSAKAQADVASRITPLLDVDEANVYRRGRNLHTRSAPKTTTSEEYHSATAIEALFGYLYLCGRLDRINELFDIVVES